MAIAYSSAGTLAASAGTTSLSTAFPATVGAGDTCIIVAASYSNITLPASFVSQAQVADVPSGTNFRLGWRYCNGTEGGTSVNVAPSSSNHVVAQIIRFTGAGSATPTYEGYSAVTGQDFAGSMTTPSVTSTLANTLGVLIGIANNNVTFTAASGYTERLDNATAASTGWGITVDTIAKAAAATTAAGTITPSAAVSAGYVVFGFALKPDDGVIFNAGYTPEVPRLLRPHRMIGY